MIYSRKIALVRQFDLAVQSMTSSLASLDYHVARLQVCRNALTQHLDAHIRLSKPAAPPATGSISFPRASHYVHLSGNAATRFQELVKQLSAALDDYESSYQRADHLHKTVTRLLSKLNRHPAHKEDVLRRYPIASELDDRMTAYRSLGKRIDDFHQELLQHPNHRRNRRCPLHLRFSKWLQHPSRLSTMRSLTIVVILMLAALFCGLLTGAH